MSYLGYLFLFGHSGVQHILRCVFALFSAVVCTLCCQLRVHVHAEKPHAIRTSLPIKQHSDWSILEYEYEIPETRSFCDRKTALQFLPVS